MGRNHKTKTRNMPGLQAGMFELRRGRLDLGYAPSTDINNPMPGQDALAEVGERAVEIHALAEMPYNGHPRQSRAVIEAAASLALRKLP